MDSFASWLAQLRKGVVELLILRLLDSGGPMHGYGIVAELKVLGQIVAGESTVYPVLRRLEGDKLVEASWSTDAPGNPRKYYRITDEGRDFLLQAAREWDALAQAMVTLKGRSR